MRKKSFLCLLFFCCLSCVYAILNLQNINDVKKQKRLPKLFKCERAHSDNDAEYDPNACSWMFGLNPELKGAELHCVTCKEVKEYLGKDNQNLTCNKARILGKINGPTKYCIARKLNGSTQTLNKHHEFVFQGKCQDDAHCKDSFPDTEFTHCARDGECENDYGMDVSGIFAKKEIMAHNIVQNITRKESATARSVILKEYTKHGQECTKDRDCCDMADMCSKNWLFYDDDGDDYKGRRSGPLSLDEYEPLRNWFGYDSLSEYEPEGQALYDYNYFLDSLSKESSNSSSTMKFNVNETDLSTDIDNTKSKEYPKKRDRTLLRSGHRRYVSSTIPKFKCLKKYGSETGKCVKEECSFDGQCPEKTKCVLHRCQPEGKVCDPAGNCPDGYKNYLGTCLPELAEGCKNLSLGCPSYTLCNKKDKNCYVISCWKDGDCYVPSAKCLQINSIGFGHCYNTECNDNDDCPSCMRCINSACARIECNSNTDCGPMYVCSEGQCAPEKCFKDYECGLNGRCFKHSCYPKPPKTFNNPLALCKKDDDCELNQNFEGKCLKLPGQMFGKCVKKNCNNEFPYDHSDYSKTAKRS